MFYYQQAIQVDANLEYTSNDIIIQMKLPNRKNAIIGKRKLTHYLLSLTHPEGKSKAKFFRKIGFNEINVDKFEHALLKIGRTNNVVAIKEETKVDKKTSEVIKIIKYDIDGLIKAPDGKKYKVRTGWAIDVKEGIPHLATALPSRLGV